ncbi:Limbic system-associated membrane protein [Anabarilius grahami]|uniref:Limbic system-associated membrane protein n=1 Tax=Anabarilius grahami TaxID=495550 RepID=A0A3N0Z8A8_ANAGA|nr:Limbic system-associated membrane protein [Anabarilius grahami]
MFVWGRTSFRQLQACFFRLLCFIPTGFPVISVDSQRSTDNITIRQGDTAVIRCNEAHPNAEVFTVYSSLACRDDCEYNAEIPNQGYTNPTGHHGLLSSVKRFSIR